PGLDAVDPSPWITDLADTAAIIANLDLVVTTDTAVAHLAGAMGKEVWLMLWWNADWRWGVDRTDSYLYPHVRLLRQATPGDWESVLAAVASL
ncbi:MAG: glycosyltransferase family 9 protein, partial [Caulobacterales bacterium]